MICAYIIALVVLLDNRISCSGKQWHDEACESTQYLEFGKKGTIYCFFNEDAIGVLWYNTTNYENNNPIVDYQNQIKTGAGYLSGEFDVDQNGSLVIYNVSLKHNKAFHVAVVLLEEGPQSIGDITIIVFIKPSTEFPLIDKCWNTSNVCYSNVYDPLIHCSVVNAHPSIPLNLKVRTVAGDKNISTNMSVKSAEQKFTSIVSTRNVFQYTPLLSLLVCQASSPPEVLKTNESQILVQNKRFDIRVKLEQAVRYYADQSKKMELTCADSSARWLVWKRVPFADAEHEDLMYSVSTLGHLSEKFVTDAIMGTNGSFVVPLTDVRHEGLYYCIYGDGKADGVTAYNVSVVVHPVPAYPVIEVCKSRELEERQPPCQFKAKPEGTLTCRVKNVRPLVQLEWKTLNESDSGFISFRNLNQTNKDNGETFDVTLTTMYSLKNLSLDKLTIQCTVLESNEVHVGLMSTLELSFEKVLDNEVENGNEVEAPSKHRVIIILAIFGAIILVIAVFISAVAVKRKFNGNRSRSSSPTTPQNIEEEISFVSRETSKPEDHLDSKATSSDDRMVIDLDDKKRAAISDVIGEAREVLFEENSSGPCTDLEVQSPLRQSESPTRTEQMDKIMKVTEKMSREADRMAKEADRLAMEADRVTEGLERLEKLSQEMKKRTEGTDEKVDAMFNMLEGLVDIIQRRASRVPPSTPPSAAPLRCVTNTTPPPMARKRCPLEKQNEIPTSWLT